MHILFRFTFSALEAFWRPSRVDPPHRHCRVCQALVMQRFVEEGVCIHTPNKTPLHLVYI